MQVIKKTQNYDIGNRKYIILGSAKYVLERKIKQTIDKLLTTYIPLWNLTNIHLNNIYVCNNYEFRHNLTIWYVNKVPYFHKTNCHICDHG